MTDINTERNESLQGLKFKNISQAILYLLKMASKKNKSANVEFSSFVTFVKKILDKPEAGSNVRELFSADVESDIISQLEYLHQEHICILEYEQKIIKAIVLPDYYIDIIRLAYSKLDSDIQVSFPTEENLKVSIPQQFVNVINLKSDFIAIITQKPEEKPKILKLVVPENMQPIIITSDLVPKKLLEYAVYKIKLYMENPRNSSYIEHKLISAIKQKDIALREMLTGIVTRVGSIIQTFLEPNDFSFTFWAHFTNLVIQEYRKKEIKLAREADFCLAAHLLALFNIFYKGAQQREKEKQIALKIIENSLRNQPYVFTQDDIYRFKDKNGFPIIRKITKTEINDFLGTMLVTEKADELPELIKLTTIDKNEYLIHRQSILSFCVKLVYEASIELRKTIINKWINLLRRYTKTKAMTSDVEFLKDIDAQVKSRYPVLYSLLSFELLYMTRRVVREIPGSISEDIERLFNKRGDGLQTITVILSLNRKEMYQEACKYLPFLERLPVIGPIIVFIKRFFWGIRSKAPKAQAVKPGETSGYKANERYESEESRRGKADSLAKEIDNIGSIPTYSQKDIYRKAMSSLERQFTGDEVTIDEKLEDLAEKWNPLYDVQGKNDLINDVNSIIRDYINSLRNSFKVRQPDSQRIRVLAETLARNRSFEKIKKKNNFIMYIELYIVKLLNERLMNKKFK